MSIEDKRDKGEVDEIVVTYRKRGNKWVEISKRTGHTQERKE